MSKQNLVDSIFQLICKTSTELPSDVLNLVNKSFDKENVALAQSCLRVILKNNELAKKKSLPLCQDTGNLIFKVVCPNKSDYLQISECIKEATKQATKLGLLRKNSVDPLTQKNTGTNMGPGMPQIKFEISDSSDFKIYLVLKGGGCENVSAQYSLMRIKSASETDLETIQKVILKTVVKAQGFGCSPGFLGVCIGGDRETGFTHAKEQFLRKMNDENPIKKLAKLEKDILKKANKLNIGPMGLGGKTTLLGVKIGVLNRIPPSFFITISYMCWAFRRQGITLDKNNKIKKYLY